MKIKKNIIILLMITLLLTLWMFLSDHNLTENNENIAQNKTEIVHINEHYCHIEYVQKDEIYPAYGYTKENDIAVRNDLSPRIKRFVRAHELYHCYDESQWGDWIGKEFRANIIPGFRDPVGLIATIWGTITDLDRISFYLKRTKEGR
jgi:hypothetical protein